MPGLAALPRDPIVDALPKMMQATIEQLRVERRLSARDMLAMTDLQRLDDAMLHGMILQLVRHILTRKIEDDVVEDTKHEVLGECVPTTWWQHFRATSRLYPKRLLRRWPVKTRSITTQNITINNVRRTLHTCPHLVVDTKARHFEWLIASPLATYSGEPLHGKGARAREADQIAIEIINLLPDALEEIQRRTGPDPATGGIRTLGPATHLLNQLLVDYAKTSDRRPPA